MSNTSICVKMYGSCRCVYCIFERKSHIENMHVSELNRKVVRYISKANNGRYEVVDTLFDIVVCYGDQSEFIGEIVRAMNNQYKEDKKSK